MVSSRFTLQSSCKNERCNTRRRESVLLKMKHTGRACFRFARWRKPGATSKMNFYRRLSGIESRDSRVPNKIIKTPNSIDTSRRDKHSFSHDITGLRKTRGDIALIDYDINSSKAARAPAPKRGSALPAPSLKMLRILRYVSKTFRRWFIRCQPARAIVLYRNTYVKVSL